mmetsp:Transcript_54764/g.111783  ORF Transcript_54764/g.111783 Transcript_54764/m.111783 type:complete len:233 (-) Transcript_54764:293-991(-)
MEAEKGSAREISVEIHSRGKSEHSQTAIILSYETLAGHFHENLDSVASKLHVSKTAIKSACRRLGIHKWPYAHKGSRKRNPSKHCEQGKKKDGDLPKKESHAADNLNPPALEDFSECEHGHIHDESLQKKPSEEELSMVQTSPSPSAHSPVSVRSSSTTISTTEYHVSAGAQRKIFRSLCEQDLQILLNISSKSSQTNLDSPLEQGITPQDLRFLYSLSTRYRATIPDVVKG